MVPYGTVWYRMVPYGCHMVPYGTLWYLTVPFFPFSIFHFSMFPFSIFLNLSIFQFVQVLLFAFFCRFFYNKRLPINHLWWLLVFRCLSFLRQTPGRMVTIWSEQVGSGQSRSDQVRASQIRSEQVREGQSRSEQVRAGQCRSVQVRSDHDYNNFKTFLAITWLRIGRFWIWWDGSDRFLMRIIVMTSVSGQSAIKKVFRQKTCFFIAKHSRSTTYGGY